MNENKPKMKSALMLGVNPNAEREEHDYYATNPHAMEIALPFLEKIGISKNLWECACGEGHLSRVLVSHGYNVKSTDLIDRGYGIGNVNFLETTEHWHGDIITNPPFKYAKEFVEKGFELIDNGNKLFLFLKIQFLESKSRKKLFEKYPLKHLLVYSKRQQCAKNADFEHLKATTQCYCWFVFEKGYKGDSNILWI